ncbi:hypothetical protein L332_07335 [Agrococcus pavilionensis RW1]|uniref:Dihydrolipoyl dehydrogenase n=1 Tax=Agrococcus pavilionensis RW1 TaxID=1330458 RepID=U1LPE2_9MICO|nr:dihydrolipoyl dehydrogenase [Agrococcus pavilionensis]ERG64264.1 hypothetical protein L332_07335 [Agrococcus pavilionensis RW1]
MERFDVVVLGAGPGGYTAAIRAAQLGRSVAIVEPSMWGGVCLNIGCIPTKALLRHAEIADLVTVHRDRFGLRGEMTVDYGVAFARSREVADGRVKGVHYLMRKHGIVELHGKGRFRDARTIDVVLNDGGRRALRFGDAIVATGATPAMLTGINRSDRVVTYEALIMRDAPPPSIVIVGGGAIGVEFATLLSSFGTSVTLVEAQPRLLPNEDAEVAIALEKALSARGVTIVTGATVQEIADGRDGTSVVVDHDGLSRTIAADTVLVAIGFRPNSAALGLDAVGVQCTPRGAIEIDDSMRTSASNVWAIGDVTAKLQLAHVAEAQGMVAAESIASAPTTPITDYRILPRAVFSTPQVASFGLTEEQARTEVGAIVVSRFPLAASGRAHALGAPEGFVKLIAEPQHGELLGAHLVGAEVSELLPELTLAAQYEISAAEIARNVHVHPSMSEAVLEAAHGVLGQPINL